MSRGVVSGKKRRGERDTWKKSPRAWEKESTVILQPAFLIRGWTLLLAQASPPKLSAPLEAKLGLPSQPWSRGVGLLGKQGRSLSSLSGPATRGKGPKMVVVSSYVNLAVPGCWLSSCFPGWKRTLASPEASHPAPTQQGSRPNPTESLDFLQSPHLLDFSPWV